METGKNGTMEKRDREKWDHGKKGTAILASCLVAVPFFPLPGIVLPIKVSATLGGAFKWRLRHL